jgi:hypothetical protein
LVRQEGRDELVDLRRSALPWMLWQLAQVTSFSSCWPDVQNARLRLLAWQPRQVSVRCSTVPFMPNGLAGFLLGSLRCSAALPWQAWHMLPSASLRAPCGVRSMARHCASWQFAHTGACWPGTVGLSCANADALSASASHAPDTATKAPNRTVLSSQCELLRRHCYPCSQDSRIC